MSYGRSKGASALGTVSAPAGLAEGEARSRGDTHRIQSSPSRREEELGTIRRPHRMVPIVGILRDLIRRAGRRKRLDVDRDPVRPSREAYATQRPSGENTAPVRGPATRRHRSGWHFLSFSENTHRVVAWPCRRCTASARHQAAHDSGICGPLVGLRQPLRRPGAVRALPEDAQVAFAIRLERDALAVRGPDGKPVVPLSSTSAVALSSSQPVINPEAGLLAVVAAECDVLAVGRHARQLVGARLDLQRFRSTFAIEQADGLICRRRRHRAWDEHEGPRAGDTELCDAAWSPRHPFGRPRRRAPVHP